LTIIKESSPRVLPWKQTVQTKTGCKTSSLDTKNNRIVLISPNARRKRLARHRRPMHPLDSVLAAIAAVRESGCAVGWALISRLRGIHAAQLWNAWKSS